jgi:hypothetical protein
MHAYKSFYWPPEKSVARRPLTRQINLVSSIRRGRSDTAPSRPVTNLLGSRRLYAGTRQRLKQTLATCQELSEYAAFHIFYSANFLILNIMYIFIV